MTPFPHGRQGLRHAPNDASLLNNLSIALLQTGRYEEAISDGTDGAFRGP